LNWDFHLDSLGRMKNSFFALLIVEITKFSSQNTGKEYNKSAKCYFRIV